MLGATRGHFKMALEPAALDDRGRLSIYTHCLPRDIDAVARGEEVGCRLFALPNVGASIQELEAEYQRRGVDRWEATMQGWVGARLG